ncbi:amino acid permease 8-like [Silene latifolia]|uniref:amino acid permease 8-like n=1 Tax=Silene latifolia TaxID=37657 RepID=UPI003D76D2E1
MGGTKDEEFQHGSSVLSTNYKFADNYDEEFDDDGKPKRSGTVWTASAHIITAIIGSGVLSLAWATAQLGWIGGIGTLVIFSGITLYTSNLLADCYRSPDPVTGKRNPTYMDQVQANLGRSSRIACGLVQYANLSGMVIGYTITASISMVAVHKSNCFHGKGHAANCKFTCNPYMIGLGIFEIFLSQIRNLHKLTWLSTVAAIMSFGYATIGISLAIAKIASGSGGKTTLTGVEVGIDVTGAEKTWKMFRALGDIAFAYSFAQVLVEIQDTLKSTPPENKVMKKANTVGVITTTSFYMMCGCLGYAAFGNSAPGNMLTGFGFYEPFWLVDLANIFIVIHLVGAYQVFAQPVYSKMESLAAEKWPNSTFVKAEYPIKISSRIEFSLNLLRLTGRTIFVILITTLAMAMPFFNDILSLLGSIGFWPLTVYFPVEMYIAQNKIKWRSIKWFVLQLLSLLCLLVSLAAAVGSIQGVGESLRTSKPFQYKV